LAKLKIDELVKILSNDVLKYNTCIEMNFCIENDEVYSDCWLAKSGLNEVACNRFDYIWIQYKGIKRRIPNPLFRFYNEDFYRRVIENRITASAREEMNAGEPFINCTLVRLC